jgi:hypothetical protein
MPDTTAHVLDPHGDVVLRTHYHDNDGLPDQLEVVAAPTQAVVDLHLLRRWPVGRTSLIYNGDTLVFGTPGLGRGRVAYQIYAWDAQERALRVVRLPDVPDGWYEEHGEPKPDAPLPPASDEPREHPGTGLITTDHKRIPSRELNPIYDDDGRTECEVCGKWVYPIIHSCKGMPVTAAASEGYRQRGGEGS